LQEQEKSHSIDGALLFGEFELAEQNIFERQDDEWFPVELGVLFPAKENSIEDSLEPATGDVG
jgi:hypothetical protein